MAATALRLINAYGKAASFVHTVPGAYNVATSETAAATTTTTTVKTVIDDCTKHFGEDLIQANDVAALLAQSAIAGVTPVPGDQLVLSDISTLTVVQVKPIYSGESVALYVLLAR